MPPAASIAFPLDERLWWLVFLGPSSMYERLFGG